MGVASDYVRSGVKINVKTNYTPEISVAAANYDPSRSSGPAESPRCSASSSGSRPR